ncbi:replicative DNA helicase [Candidatus Azobacteroides pseudotrichonymphae]|uniref:Replicative DNA helicase n=1 Tax=Azobacteroides pseudotrichonymphae genomovar. CFP2 TaxID=511995 RepID=B6YR35_AZOPC|nr:replicative DNA helicase [Candidatus Azobacteroides pseudotrichonymphae]BAG83657.1 replicative DNA helicase DnaB [Candidatus Azobacteroides pseudotrichonymphae genomovar. CFP2]
MKLPSTPKSSKSPTSVGGRIQPQARELEEAVLGALMLEKDSYALISEILTPQSFYDKTHELIFTAIRDLAGKPEQAIDMLTVIEQLKSNGTLKDAGGVSHIASITQKVVSSEHLEYHARIIAQKSLARELISFSFSLTDKAFDETIDVSDLMQEAEAQLFELSRKNIKKDLTHIAQIVMGAYALIKAYASRPDKVFGLPSGFTELDALTLGWQKSDLIIIAGRPSMGKTAFVLSMAKNMAIDKKIPVAFFSLEMSNIQLINRLIVNVSNIDSEKIKNGKLKSDEWVLLEEKIKLLYNAPIYVDDTPSLSIFEFRTKARRLVKEYKVQCLFVDYLQLMNVSGISFSIREQEVSFISRSLKSLAKELDIPIIALSQLNRNIENRSQCRRPQLSDLRESGAIEQDADVVCFIHRPEQYKILEDAQGNDLKGKAEIILAKHRNGPTGDILLSFKQEFIRFQNLNDDQVVLEYQSRLNSQINSISQEKICHQKHRTESANENLPF